MWRCWWIGFYGKVRVEALLGRSSTTWRRSAVPRMTTLDSPDAARHRHVSLRALPKHAVLAVEKAHFDRWLQLFGATVDENFSGPKAEEAKGALSIADTFARRMGLLPMGTVLLQP